MGRTAEFVGGGRPRPPGGYAQTTNFATTADEGVRPPRHEERRQLACRREGSLPSHRGAGWQPPSLQAGSLRSIHHSPGRYVAAMLTMRLVWPAVNLYMHES